MKLIYPFFIIFLLTITSCTNNDNKDDAGLIRITLEPQVPSPELRGVRWSPKGEKLKLQAVDEGMVTEIKLGSADLAAMAIRLSKNNGSEYFNTLDLDLNRDGEFGGEMDTSLICKPNETRGKIWSSFSCKLPIPFVKNKYHKALINPYPVSFWYVEDPSEESAEQVIRYSRRGWIQGKAETEFGVINLLIKSIWLLSEEGFNQSYYFFE